MLSGKVGGGRKRIKVDGGGGGRKSVRDSATANGDEEESTKIFLCSCDGVRPDLRILSVVSGKSCTAENRCRYTTSSTARP